MKQNLINQLLAFGVMVLIIALWVVAIAHAQEPGEEIPPFYARIFSTELLQYIVSVVGTTKLIRNILGDIKGVWAAILTVAIGTAVGEFQLGIIGGQGHLIGLGAGLAGGLAVAGVFKVFKLIGKNVIKAKTVNNL